MAGTDKAVEQDSGVLAPTRFTPCVPRSLRAGFSLRSGAEGEAVVRSMMSGKIHRATVTQANLDYEGSITLDPDLMDGAGILPYEKVHVVDVTNGARLETYAIKGERGSGEVCINGAAAHLVHRGDIVIIIAYQQMTDAEARDLAPRMVYVDAFNRITRTSYGDGFSHNPREAVAAH